MSNRKLLVVTVVALLGVCAGQNVSTAACATHGGPTAAHLDSVDAVAGWGQVEIRWVTSAEPETFGFNVMRSLSSDGPWEQVNEARIDAEGTDYTGASYFFRDAPVGGGVTYYYYLQETLITGGRLDHMGEWVRSVTPNPGTYLPVVVNQ